MVSYNKNKNNNSILSSHKNEKSINEGLLINSGGLLINKVKSPSLCSNHLDCKDGSHNNLNKYEEFAINLYSKIENLIDTYGIYNQTEIKIEQLVLKQFIDLNKGKAPASVLGINTSKFTSQFNEFCEGSADSIVKYLEKRRLYLNSEQKLSVDCKSSLIKSSDIQDFIFKDIYTRRN